MIQINSLFQESDAKFTFCLFTLSNNLQSIIIIARCVRIRNSFISDELEWFGEIAKFLS